MFLAGIVGFAVASVLVGVSGSIAMVITWRVVQGLAGALLQPASLAILRNTFPAEKLNTAIGIWGPTVGISIAESDAFLTSPTPSDPTKPGHHAIACGKWPLWSRIPMKVTGPTARGLATTTRGGDLVTIVAIWSCRRRWQAC